jgi:hypothetical protein
MVLSTKTPIMIAMSNPPVYFLFVVYRLDVEKTRAYSIHTTHLTFNVCVMKFYITLTSFSHVLFKRSTSCLYTCYKTYLQWLHPLHADQFIPDANSSFIWFFASAALMCLTFHSSTPWISCSPTRKGLTEICQVTAGAMAQVRLFLTIDQQNVHWAMLLPLW